MPDKYFPEEEVEQKVETPEEPKPDFATKEDIAELRGLVEGLSSSMRDFGQPRAQPEAPKGPSTEEQLATINSNLEQLYEQFDNAIQEGKGASKIQKEISKLENAKADLRYGAQINELRSFGTYAIGQLTEKVVSGSMPLLDIPEVKKAYTEAIKTMTPDQSANPEVLMTAYNYACGACMDKIIDHKMQENLRKAEEVAVTQTPAGKTGRTQKPEDDPNRIPRPDEVLPAESIAAVKEHPKYQGDFDAQYKAMGYKGWDDYWTKTGKAYFRGEEET